MNVKEMNRKSLDRKIEKERAKTRKQIERQKKKKKKKTQFLGPGPEK